MIKDFASDFVEKEIKSLASDIDRNSMFSAEFVKNLFDLGFMERFVPEKYGGSCYETGNRRCFVKQIPYCQRNI